MVNRNDVTVVNCLGITREKIPNSRMTLQEGGLDIVIKKASGWLSTGQDGLDFGNDDLVCLSLGHARAKVPIPIDGTLICRLRPSLGAKC